MDHKNFTAWFKSLKAADVNHLHHKDDVDASFKSHHHTLGKGHLQAAPGDHTHDGEDSEVISGSNARWNWDDRGEVSSVATDLQKVWLTYTPVAESLFVRWHPGGGAGLPVLNENFDLDGNLVLIHDNGYFAIGDTFSFQYQIQGDATEEDPGSSDPDDPRVTPPTPGYPEVVVDDGVTAYYRRGESVGNVSLIDSSGNGHHGLNYNNTDPPFWVSPTLEVAGLLDGSSDTAASYNGTNQSGVVADGAWMDWDGNKLTLEAIIKPSNFADAPFGKRGIISRDENSVTQQRVFTWYINTAGKLVFEKNPGNDGGLGTATSTGNTALALNVEHHVVVTIDNTSIDTYIDGVLDKTTAAAYLFNQPSNSRIAIGGGFAGGNSPNIAPFAGVLDEVAIYIGTKLTADQIANHAALALG